MRSEKEIYGEDADGNRGQWITNYYLEESDEENYVIPQLKDHIKQYGFIGKQFSACIISDYGEEILFPIEPEDYSYLEYLFEVWIHYEFTGKDLIMRNSLTLEEAELYCKLHYDCHIRYEGELL